MLPLPPPSDDQLKARRQLDEARQKFRDRKRDTRRKVVAGGVVLKHAKHDPDFGRALRDLLRIHLTRPQDRALFPELLDG